MPSLKSLPIADGGAGSACDGRRPQAGASGDARPQWRSVEERNRPLAPEGEFPAGDPWTPTRREVVQLLSASAALATLSGCLKQPDEKILPYTRQPEEVLPGRPLHYATASMYDGLATGLLVTASEGHPTKVEGNPQHPSSLGSSGIFDQASILQLYDPQRAGVILNGGVPRSYRDFLAAQHDKALALRAKDGGAGLRFLLHPTSSPLLADLRDRIAKNFPAAKFQAFTALPDEEAQKGARLAFGQPFDTVYDFSRATVIASLGGDPLSAQPGNLRHMRTFADKRDPSKEMNRLYAVESTLTVTGMSADHRLRVKPSQMPSIAVALAARLSNRGGALAGLSGAAQRAKLDAQQQKFVDALAKDLSRAGSGAVVVPGHRQPPVVHALAHAINAALGSDAAAQQKSVLVDAETGYQGLRSLAEDIRAKKVDTLVVTAWNPVYTAPFDLNLREAFASVPNSIYRGLYLDETGTKSTWFLPATHPLEDWGDGRGHDGTTTFLQPLISPLFNGIAEAQVLAAFIGEGDRTPYALLRDFWRKRSPNDFDRMWDQWISAGLIKGSSPATAERPQVRGDAIAAAVAQERLDEVPGYELEIFADSKVWDGRFGNNAWLQELPDPITKVTWDNAALISPATARELGVETHDLVDLGLRGPPVHASVYVLPGQADGVVSVAMGYGRTSATEQLASATGFDVAPLRRSDSPWSGRGLTVARTGRKRPLAITQEHWTLNGRELALETTKEKIEKHETEDIEKMREPMATIHTPWDYKPLTYKWGMGVDLGRRTGCSACMVACQSENNVPVVGRGNVAKSREMHWLRIDRYFEGELDNPSALPQPMFCQHCETAPCEYVCPVNATVHSDEGLNEMVYNRCIGTRYCSNNCPYKVRRFNFFNYTYDLGDVDKLRMNPDVTVRSRGVMEKCTYCVQRIERARIDTRVAGKGIHDGDLQTACQQACPAHALTFGNLNDPSSEVSRWHADGRHYFVLNDLGTRPRTAYLARVRNPNPELASR